MKSIYVGILVTGLLTSSMATAAIVDTMEHNTKEYKKYNTVESSVQFSQDLTLEATLIPASNIHGTYLNSNELLWSANLKSSNILWDEEKTILTIDSVSGSNYTNDTFSIGKNGYKDQEKLNVKIVPQGAMTVLDNKGEFITILNKDKIDIGSKAAGVQVIANGAQNIGVGSYKIRATAYGSVN